MNSAVETKAQPLTLVTNWTSLLKKYADPAPLLQICRSGGMQTDVSKHHHPAQGAVNRLHASCKSLRAPSARGLASYTWLAMSSGWRGFDFADWNIKQSQGQTYGNIETDSDESSGRGHGGF